MEKNSSRKSKLIYVDERGSQSSCSATDEYIASEIQKIELVFKIEEDELAKQRARRNDPCWSDGYVSSCDETDTIRNCSDNEFSDHDSELMANFDSLVRKTTSPFLFRNEKMEPLSFVLLLNDTIAERRLAKLIQRGGGQVYPKVRQMDDYSIVVVKDKLLTSHVGPVFRLEYLLRCISRNKIVSVNPYLRTFDNAPPLHKYDYMKIFYFKQVGWSELPQRILLNKPHNKVKVEKSSTTPRPLPTPRPPPTPPPPTQDSDDDDEVVPQTPPKKDIVPSQKTFRRLQNLDVDDDDEVVSHTPAKKDIDPSQKTFRRLQNLDVDDDDEVVSQTPSKKDIVPSQKKFRRLQNLDVDDDDEDNDDFVSQTRPKKDTVVPSQKTNRRLQNLDVDDDEVVSQAPSKKDITPSQKKFRRLKISESSSSDDVTSQTPSKKDPVPSSHKKFSRFKVWSGNDESSSEDSDFQRDSKVQKVEKVKRSTVNKHTRMMYSDAEDSSIVKYIADNDGYNSVKGNLLWREMEKVNICPKRTWQSMKEHFLKKVMYNTNSYRFLTDGQKRKFQKLLLK